MLGKDLRPGHIVSAGLVVKVDHSGADIFWNKPNFTCINVEDPYFGQCTGELQLDKDYEIIHEEGTPEYREALKKASDLLLDAAHDRLKDMRTVLGYLK